MRSYFDYMRSFWDFAFENPDKIKPNHCALYAFCVEHCNRLGWKEKFGLPTTMVKDAIGIRSYGTYIQTLKDLVDFGFIELIEQSKNQYSSNIIALSNFDKAHTKALDKALVKHTSKQHESTHQSIDSIDRPIYNYTNIQDTSVQAEIEIFTPFEIVDFVNKTFGKQFTERQLPRFDRDLINDLIRVHGYEKKQILSSWFNITKDPFHTSKKFNVVTFRYLSETKTIERYLFWKDENETNQQTTNGTFSRKNLNL